MCKTCVDEGRITQAELDQRLAAGDRKLMPIEELGLLEFMDSISEMGGRAIAEGAGWDAVYAVAEEQLDIYMNRRAMLGNPPTDDEVAEVGRAAEQRIGALWN